MVLIRGEVLGEEGGIPLLHVFTGELDILGGEGFAVRKFAALLHRHLDGHVIEGFHLFGGPHFDLAFGPDLHQVIVHHPQHFKIIGLDRGNRVPRLLVRDPSYLEDLRVAFWSEPDLVPYGAQAVRGLDVVEVAVLGVDSHVLNFVVHHGVRLFFLKDFLKPVDEGPSLFRIVNAQLLGAHVIELGVGPLAHVPVPGRGVLGVELGVGEEVRFHADRQTRENRDHTVELVLFEPQGEQRVGHVLLVEVDLETQLFPLLCDVVAGFVVGHEFRRHPCQKIDLRYRFELFLSIK